MYEAAKSTCTLKVCQADLHCEEQMQGILPHNNGNLNFSEERNLANVQ
jgi:hypothetical protein